MNRGQRVDGEWTAVTGTTKGVQQRWSATTAPAGQQRQGSSTQRGIERVAAQDSGSAAECQEGLQAKGGGARPPPPRGLQCQRRPPREDGPAGIPRGGSTKAPAARESSTSSLTATAPRRPRPASAARRRRRHRRHCRMHPHHRRRRTPPSPEARPSGRRTARPEWCPTPARLRRPRSSGRCWPAAGSTGCGARRDNRHRP